MTADNKQNLLCVKHNRKSSFRGKSWYSQDINFENSLLSHRSNIERVKGLVKMKMSNASGHLRGHYVGVF